MRVNRSRPRRVLIVGGSIAGLLAGNLLHRAGWDVTICERTAGVMEGRGAGITVLPGLIEGFRAAGVEQSEESLGVLLPGRVALDRAGRIVAERAFSQVMTSWRRLYDVLKDVFPPERYRAGMTLERIEQNAQSVTGLFSDGSRIEAELLIGADGLRSAVRMALAPAVTPYYAGYIAWRCLADENSLSSGTKELFFTRYGVCVAPGEQGIGYAVPGQDHSTLPGRRQFNVVWYHPVPDNEEMVDLHTDSSGRHHPYGIPPSLIRPEVRSNMAELAHKVLAPQFAEAIEEARVAFFQPIVDLELPRLVFGRVAIIGDAAFVARPHVAMGVPKAAGDALALVAALKNDDYLSALSEFEVERMRMGAAIVERGRYLGSYMEAQLKSPEERRLAESRRIPEQVMVETAAPFDYGN
jgi:2-polyprenyl-6-methoxyphenol hydroxylase-like FAD-dependent oxidoreductase